MSKISIIVPCYNAAEYLPRCVNSLLNQTIPVDIILVNDGSSDDTLTLALEYQKNNSNIQIISTENQGLPQARKTGFLAAKTPFIAFLDADDWVKPDMYHQLYAALVNTKADMAFCGTCKTYSSQKEVPLKQYLKDGTILTGRQAMHCLHCHRDVFPYMWNKLFRKETLTNVVFPSGNTIGEDYATLIQILLKCNRIVSIKKPLHHYFQKSSSMSKTGFTDIHVLSYNQYQQIESFLIEKDPAVKRDICGYLAIEYMALVIKMFRNQNYHYQMISDIQDYIAENKLHILRNKDLHFSFKVFTVSFLCNYKITCAVYCLISRLFKYFNNLT